MYEMYENAIRMLLSCLQEPYKMYKLYEEYEVEDIWGSTVFAKESEAGHLPARDLPPGYNSKSI